MIINDKKHGFIMELYLLIVSTAIPGNLGNYTRFILVAVLVLTEALKNHGKIKIHLFPGSTCYIVFVVVCLLAGLKELFVENASIWFFIRDIILISVYGLEWLAVYQIACRIKLQEMWYTAAVAITSITIILLFNAFIRIFNGATTFGAFSDGSLQAQWALALGIFIFTLPPSEMSGCFFGRKIDKIILLLRIVVSVLSFSRTLFLILGCLFLPMSFQRKNIKNIARIIALIGFGLMGVVIFLPDVFGTFYHKLINSFGEISASNRWTLDYIVQNWRGYEVYCARQTFSNYSGFESLFGKGFGATVETRYAWLVTGESQLPFLHNGYYTALIKGGLVGLTLYIMLFIMQLLFVSKQKEFDIFQRNLYIGIVVALAFTSIAVQGVYFGSMYILPWAIITCFVARFENSNNGKDDF